MRSIATWMLLVFFTPTLVVAQYYDLSVPVKMSPFQLNQVEMITGITTDEYGEISYDDLMSMAKDPSQMHRDLNGLTKEVNTSTAGFSFITSVSFSPLNKKNRVYRDNREVRIGIGLHSSKEAMLSYKDEFLDTSIVFCNLQNEITLELAYFIKGIWGKKFYWQVGACASAGSSFNNEMVLISGKYLEPGEHPSEQPEKINTAETFKARSVRYARFYVPFAIGYGFNSKWILSTEIRHGAGLQFIQGSSTNNIQGTSALLVGVRHKFK